MGSSPHTPGSAPAKPKLHPTVRGSVPRRVLWYAVVLAWVRAAALAGLVIAVGHAIDRLVENGSVVPALAWLLGFGALAAGSTLAQTLLTTRAESRAEAALRRSILDSVFDQGVVAATSRSGELLSLATGATRRAAHFRAGFLGPITGAMSTPLVVIAVYAIAVDPLVALLLAAATVAVPFILGIAQRAVQPTGTAHRREQALLASAFLQAVQGLSTLVSARAADRAAVELAERGEKHRRSLMRVLAVNQILIFVIDAAVSIVVVLLAILAAASGIQSGSMTLGAGTATVLVALLVIAPVELVGQFFYIGIGGRAAERAISEQLTRQRTEPEPAPQRHPQQRPEQNPAAIELASVTAGWDPGHTVLHDFSLRVDEGEHVALVGPSGAGKSTVSALVQAHLVPVQGGVSVAGTDTRHTPGAEIRGGLAVVEQRTFLFNGSVADNLRIAKPGASEAEMWEALRLAGLADELRDAGSGLDTPVGEHGTQLSGGQSQRMAIARALLRDAPILLLDEPTSQVDLAGEAAFLRSLEQLSAGRTVLMIAHRPGAILAADRVVSLTPEGAP